jgi:hypothetical protein
MKEYPLVKNKIPLVSEKVNQTRRSFFSIPSLLIKRKKKRSRMSVGMKEKVNLNLKKNTSNEERREKMSEI